MKGSNIKGILAGALLLLSGCGSHYQRYDSPEPVVATAWGDDVHSAVKEVEAERATRDAAAVVLISYSAREPSGYNKVYSIRHEALEFAVRDASFNSIPITRRYNPATEGWRYLIPARVGMVYQLYVRNHSRDTNYEVVATVDGLDVLNGKPGSLSNNGYIVNAGSSLSIQGFRKDRKTEAAFTFADVSGSYAANSEHGDVRNIGVIGFAAFELKGKAKGALPPCSAQAFPGDATGFAPPPCRK